MAFKDNGGGNEPSDQLSPVQVSTAPDRFEILRGIEGQNSRLDLSRFGAAPVSHLSDFSFEGQGAFPAEG